MAALSELGKEARLDEKVERSKHLGQAALEQSVCYLGQERVEPPVIRDVGQTPGLEVRNVG